ncbi:acyl-ACP thioesterase [Weissella cibaria]|uniref:acyl-[acyl-carrier-protein] thioesterase n=1 Tax=Weissella cibaria TaxID=137591 RepID=UPI001196CB26|nr:acyl-ACP thioesterase domain-containing protein [Weissella cibaria]TVV26060.1 acyl-ACP thioesterase [Weissella cibaria]
MAEIYSMQHQVLYYEADVTGKLSLPMIFNLAVLSSTQQSVDLEVGPDFFHAQGIGWIILQHMVEINRRPKIGENLTLQTLAKEFNPFFAKRMYRILDEAGNVLVEIDALYAMIDMERRRMARIPQEMVDAYEPERVKKIPRQPEPQHMIADIPVDVTQEYVVRYLDIDSNQHVNNSKYFDWIQDVLDHDFVKTHEPKRLNIKYEHEVLLGDTIKSEAQTLEDATIHRIWSGDTLSAEAAIEWTDAEN